MFPRGLRSRTSPVYGFPLPMGGLSKKINVPVTARSECHHSLTQRSTSTNSAALRNRWIKEEKPLSADRCVADMSPYDFLYDGSADVQCRSLEWVVVGHTTKARTSSDSQQHPLTKRAVVNTSPRSAAASISPTRPRSSPLWLGPQAPPSASRLPLHPATT